jgi:hypothetical protein
MKYFHVIDERSATFTQGPDFKNVVWLDNKASTGLSHARHSARAPKLSLQHASKLMRIEQHG